MKAYVYEFRNGKAKVGTGRVTPNYKNMANMKKFYIQNLPAGTYQIFAYVNWDRCYGKPDHQEVVHIYGYPPELTSHGEGPPF